MYVAATSAAWAFKRAAMAAIAAEYAAWYSGRRAGIALGKILADAMAVDQYNQCVNQAWIDQCGPP